MIPECVNCKNLFTCTIKDKPKGEACVMFEERDKDKTEAIETLKKAVSKNEQ